MEMNLLLTAQRLQLTTELAHSETAGGVRLVKNIPERTYLAITTKQWRILEFFREPKMVPHVLEAIIEQRLCPPLGELYELLLKAVRARILIPADHTPATVSAVNWLVPLRPKKLSYLVWGMLGVGVVLTVALHPRLPLTILDTLVSLFVCAVAAVLGSLFSASLLRGAGGEVYAVRKWFFNLDDMRMLAPRDQTIVLLAPIAVTAAITGLMSWNQPEWSFYSLIALLFMLRPILHGRIGQIIRVNANQRLSDAEHAFIFPLNRTPRLRWKLLGFSLRQPETWKEIGYGVIWTLAIGYFVGVITDTPPWTLAFWETRGPWLLGTIMISLFLLGLVYLVSELYLYTRDRAIVRRNTLRLWHRRWFKRNTVTTDQEARQRAVLRSPLLRQLSPPDQGALIAALAPHRANPWHTLHDFDQPVSHVSLVLSGKVGVYRKLRSGRRHLVQVLCEDDLVGLHAVADPKHPQYLYRTLTPVVLLRITWTEAETLLIARISHARFSNFVHKLPFLNRISLCQNWHLQAVQRFAELSGICDYSDGEVMLPEGGYNENFFVMLEGEAIVTRRGKAIGKVSGGDFFGEIGLLQNGNATAQVTAGVGARSLCIQRREFLRFVAHNYAVALELERVSSERLGRPIFPLSPGNFHTLRP